MGRPLNGRAWAAMAMLAGLGFGAAALAQDPAPASGYLAKGAAPEALRILPAPPKAGSGRETEDRAVFFATRKLKGEPRWDLATLDADLRPETVMSAFACDLGVTLDAHSAPTLMRLLQRSGMDSYAVFGPPKDFYQRPRPYLAPDAGDAPICVARSEGLSKNGSYPSGHSTVSWAWGLVLAELAPDRATEVLMRARSIGESRIVCGVHYLSDVEAGRTAGSILVAALHGDAAFRADLEKARAEVEAARNAPHVGPGECVVSDAAAAHPPY